MHWLDLTAQPWYVDLAVLAGVVTSLVTIGRYIVWPVLRGFWSAIIAAPLIAAGIDELLILVKSDVLGKLDQGVQQALLNEHRIEKAEAMLLDHEGRLAVVEKKPE